VQQSKSAVLNECLMVEQAIASAVCNRLNDTEYLTIGSKTNSPIFMYRGYEVRVVLFISTINLVVSDAVTIYISISKTDMKHCLFKLSDPNMIDNICTYITEVIIKNGIL